MMTNQNNDDSTLQNYLREISSSKPLCADEEKDLCVKIRKGDKLALQKLVTANLRFVVSVARNYQNQNLPVTDLINEGNLGLIKAAKRFDETKGFKFVSYAVWWIRQSILAAIADNSRITRVPLNVANTLFKARQVRDKYEQKHHRQPSHEEIARELRM
ncbi:MAG: sigma-70 family RNA polymerase sigma factor, partial [bacterium]